MRHAPSKLCHQIYRTTTLPNSTIAVLSSTHISKSTNKLKPGECAKVCSPGYNHQLDCRLFIALLKSYNPLPAIAVSRSSNFVTTSFTTTHASRRIPFFPILVPPPGYITLNLSSPLPSLPWPIDTLFSLMWFLSVTHCCSLAHRQILSKITSQSS